MGFSDVVECNLTGVNCSSISIEMVNTNSRTDRELNEINQQHSVEKSDGEVLYLCSEEETFRFCCISESKRQELCNVLGITYFEVGNSRNFAIAEKELGKPCVCKEIIADGNCFFRAVSFSISHSQDYHYTVRTAICNHILKNENDFKTFLRSNESSIKSHVSFMMQKVGQQSWKFCHVLIC